MLKTIVRGALVHPRLIVLAAVLVVAYGGTLLSRAEYEVFPEFVPAQASVQVEAPGLVAEQVEQLVTRPIEQAINGATGVTAVRSRSIQGLAVIDVIFREGADPFRARQIVSERLNEIAGSLPAGAGAPALSPLTSSTMDLLKIGLVSDELSPMELRDIAQWTVRPQLLSVPGVARVTLYGGALRRLEVKIRETELVARGLAVGDIVDAVRSATEMRGGGFFDTESQRILIEPRGVAITVGDLAEAVVKPAPGRSIRLGDVADITDAPTPQFGDALVMGKPGVLISTSSQFGANTLTVTRAVETALEALRPSLEARGIELYPALHRPANFIETALDGIRGDLLLGAAFITFILFAFTRDLRVALVAFVSIPLSLLATMIVLDLAGQTINTMTLGGLAVALGVVIDDAVIGTENILRRLRERRARTVRDVILMASVEVRGPVVYATLVLALTMAPVLFLTGLQGAFFAPLALSFLLATLASLLVAITVTPALALLFLERAPAPVEPRPVAAVKRMHARILTPLCRRPRLTLLATGLLGVISIIGLIRFGAELLPAFRERHYVLQVNGPSGASLAWMREVGARLAGDLLVIPGIATVEQQIGRAEAAEDTFPPNRSEFHVELAKVDAKAERRILARIRDVLASYRAIQSEALTFLGDRIGESLSGETAAIAISIFGSDLDVLDRVAREVAAAVRHIAGAVDVQVQTPPGAPSLMITLDPSRLAQAGVSARDAHDAIEAAYQGLPVATVIDGPRVVEVAVTLPGSVPGDPEAARRLLVRGGDGTLVPLERVGTLALGNARATISHDGGRRRQVVTANAATSDVAGLTDRIKTEIARKVFLPPDVYLEFSGAAEGAAAARRQLLTNVGVAAVGIVALLILAFGGGRPAALILSGVPAALAGGVAAVALGGGILSLGSLVGFVTLFGVTARNAILLVAHGDHLVREEGAVWGIETVIRATRERLVPILMTALVTALGMAPLAVATGEAGREVQGPMATVILGGLATSTAFSLFLLPPLILAFRHSAHRSSIEGRHGA